MTSRLLSAAVFGLCLSGCTVSEVSLDYQPRPGMHIVGRPEVTVGNFYDARGLAPYFVGTARNAFGISTEQVLLRVPADQAVRNAFLHALEARKMLADSGGKYYLAGEVVELGCTMHSLPTAIARVRLNVVQVGSDRIVFSKTFFARRQAHSFQHGYGDPVPILRDLVSRALQDTVDSALDDREIRRAIQQHVPRWPRGRNQGNTSPAESNGRNVGGTLTI